MCVENALYFTIKAISYSGNSQKAPGGWGFYFTFQMRLAQIKTPPMIFIFYQIFFKSLIMATESALFIRRASKRQKNISSQ